MATAYDELSEQQLLDLLEVGDEKLRSLRKQLRSSVKADSAKDMARAEKKDFSAKEKKAIRAVFDKYDRDESNAIDVGELKALSADLGCAMSDEEAQTALDEINQDDDKLIQFDEFLHWWGASSARGGLSGAKLQIMKAKLRADAAAAGVRSAMKMSQDSAGVNLGQRHRSAAVDVKIGEVDFDEAEAPMKVDFAVVPSSLATLEAEMRQHFPDTEMVRCVDDNSVRVRVVFEVRFDVGDGAAVDAFVGALEDVVSFVKTAMHGEPDSDDEAARGDEKPMPFGMKFERVGTDELVVRMWVAPPDLSEEETWRVDPLVEMMSGLMGGAYDPEMHADQLFSLLSVSLKSMADGKEFLRLESETTPQDLLENARVSAVAKLSPAVAKMMSAGFLAQALDSCSSSSRRLGAALPAVAASLFQSTTVQTHSRSPGEAMRHVAALLANVPSQIAAARGTMSDDVAAEKPLLAARLEKSLATLAKQKYTVALLLLKFIFKFSEPVTEVPPMMEAVRKAGALTGVRAVKITHSTVSVRAELKGLPLVQLLTVKDPEEWEAGVEEVEALLLKRHMALGMEVGDGEGGDGDGDDGPAYWAGLPATVAVLKDSDCGTARVLNDIMKPLTRLGSD